MSEAITPTKKRPKDLLLTNFSSITKIDTIETLLIRRAVDEDITFLKKITGLEGLSLSVTKIKSLDNLSHLTSLKELHLNYVDNIYDISVIKNLPNLELLYLREINPNSGISNVFNCEKLEILDLSESKINDISGIEKLTNLVFLNIDMDENTDHTSLRSLENLVGLKITSKTEINISLLPSSLRFLDISGNSLKNISSLSRLKNLVAINVSYTDISCLSILAKLPALEIVKAVKCDFINSIPLSLIRHTNLIALEVIHTNIDGFPKELLNGYEYEDQYKLSPADDYGFNSTYLDFGTNFNCLESLRAHCNDISEGSEMENDIKLVVIGSARVGKTSIIQKYFLDKFNVNEQSTHGIQLSNHSLQNGLETYKLTAWDYGGQDIYFSTHSLFLNSRSVFLIVWDPETENSNSYQEGGLEFQHFSLKYWVEYVQHKSPGSEIIIVQNKCDKLNPTTPPTDTKTFPTAYLSAKSGEGFELLDVLVKKACQTTLKSTSLIGVNRAKIKKRLLDNSATKKYDTRTSIISRSEFEKICDEEGGVASIEHLLRYFSKSGLIYYNPDVFDDQIIIDLKWIFKIIYSIFDRKRTYRQLLAKKGLISVLDLDDLIWHDAGFSLDQQREFIFFMTKCDICFETNNSDDGEPIYLFPDLLPNFDDNLIIKNRTLLLRLHLDAPLKIKYVCKFLDRQVIRSLFRTVEGEFSNPVLWKTGCTFEDENGNAICDIEILSPSKNDPSSQQILISVNGTNKRNLLSYIKKTIEHLLKNRHIEKALVCLTDDEWVNLKSLSDGQYLNKVLSQDKKTLDFSPYKFLIEDDEVNYINQTSSMTRSNHEKCSSKHEAQEKTLLNKNKLLVVLIHGLHGNAKKTWGNSVEILNTDLDISENIKVVSHSYPTQAFSLISKSIDIKRIAEELGERIRLQYNPNNDYDQTVLVCHSLGGLIAKQLVIQHEFHRQDYSLNLSKLIFFATPHNGASLANIGSTIPFSSYQLRQLCRNSEFIDNLNEMWVSLNIGEKISSHYILGAKDRVVAPDSAKHFWGNENCSTVIESHTSIVKIGSHDHLCYLILKEQLVKLLQTEKKISITTN